MITIMVITKSRLTNKLFGTKWYVYYINVDDYNNVIAIMVK